MVIIARARNLRPAFGLAGVHGPIVCEGITADTLSFAACAKTSTIVAADCVAHGQRKKRVVRRRLTIVFAVMRGDLLSRGDMLEDFEGDISAFANKFAVVLTVMLERDFSGYICGRVSLTLTNRAGPRKRWFTPLLAE